MSDRIPTLVPAMMAANETDAIHTFSNGTEGYGWMDANCHLCALYLDEGPAGEYCTFEEAMILNLVTPQMAAHFGWTPDPEFPEYWNAPEECPHKKDRPEDGSDWTPPPEIDPTQLVLLADPTEDAAGLVEVASPEPSFAGVSG